MALSLAKAILLAVFAAAPSVLAQNAPASASAPQLEFEAVSIHTVDPRRAQDLSRQSISPLPTNLFTMRSAPLTFLIQFGYNHREPR